MNDDAKHVLANIASYLGLAPLPIVSAPERVDPADFLSEFFDGRPSAASMADWAQADAAASTLSLSELIKVASRHCYGVAYFLKRGWLDVERIDADILRRMTKRDLAAFLAELPGALLFMNALLVSELVLSVEPSWAAMFAIERQLKPTTIFDLLACCRRGVLADDVAEALLRWLTVMKAPSPTSDKDMSGRVSETLIRRLVSTEPQSALMAIKVSLPEDAVDMLVDLMSNPDEQIARSAIAMLSDDDFRFCFAPEAVRKRAARVLFQAVAAGLCSSESATLRALELTTLTPEEILLHVGASKSLIGKYVARSFRRNAPDVTLIPLLLDRWLGLRGSCRVAEDADGVFELAANAVLAGVSPDSVVSDFLVRVRGLPAAVIRRSKRDGRYLGNELQRDGFPLAVLAAEKAFAGEQRNALWIAYCNEDRAFLRWDETFTSAVEKIRCRWEQGARTTP